MSDRQKTRRITAIAVRPGQSGFPRSLVVRVHPDSHSGGPSIGLRIYESVPGRTEIATQLRLPVDVAALPALIAALARAQVVAAAMSKPGAAE